MNKHIKDAIKNADKCNSLFSKLKGFMFSFSRKPKLFIFNKEQEVKIHTFFCFSPLKIIYFNKNWKIARQEIAKPFKILKSCRAKYILEIPHWK
jgi:uncharacterized membrane protein (UPF0127 family)